MLKISACVCLYVIRDTFWQYGNINWSFISNKHIERDALKPPAFAHKKILFMIIICVYRNGWMDCHLLREWLNGIYYWIKRRKVNFWSGKKYLLDSPSDFTLWQSDMVSQRCMTGMYSITNSISWFWKM